MTEVVVDGLPEADTPSEVLGTMHLVLYALGRELGQRYDTQLSTAIGPNWVQALSHLRKQHINKYDAHFVLSEPLKHPDSPTRACLPHGGAFYNQLEDALAVRNAWSHHEIVSLDLVTLKASIATLHAFATSAELSLGALCSAIKKRINAILNGTYPPAGSASHPGSEDIDELLGELADARAHEEALKKDVAAAQQLLEEAARAGEAKADLEARLDRIQRDLERALEEKEKLEFVIEALATAESDTAGRGDSFIPATPGHPWPGAVPERKVTMMTLHPDLFDPDTGSRISEEFGTEARSTIAGWKAIVPANATVFLTSRGQAVTYMNGSPIYLGTLGEGDDAVPQDAAVGFFVPHTYTLRMNGTIEDRESGDSLLSVNPDAVGTAERLLALVPTGGRLRVTTTGGVARHLNGEWRIVGSVRPEEWFPDHL